MHFVWELLLSAGGKRRLVGTGLSARTSAHTLGDEVAGQQLTRQMKPSLTTEEFLKILLFSLVIPIFPA